MLQNILVYGFALLSATALANFFGITHPSYIGYYIGDGSNQLEVIKMGPYLEISQVLQARMMCNRRCSHHEDCLSNYVFLWFKQMYCVLMNLNLCQNQSAEVSGEEHGGINYDKIKDTGVPQSCQNECLQLNNQSCTICHRDGCRSSDCTVCDHDCLECYTNTHPNLPLSNEVNCSLWAGVQDLYKINVTCSAEKFLLFQRSSTSNDLIQNTSTVPDVNNFGLPVYSFFAPRTAGNMYIELQDSNLTKFTAIYSGFKLGPGNNCLSLGSFINGTAGDGMHVPLSNLSLITNSSLYHPSCGPFWNISGSINLTEPTPYGVGPCPGLGTAFWGVPGMSADVFQSGITWSTLPNHTIVKISLYMF